MLDLLTTGRSTNRLPICTALARLKFNVLSAVLRQPPHDAAARHCCSSPSHTLDHLLQGEGDGLARLRQVLQQSVHRAADAEKTKEQLLGVQQQLAAAHQEAARLHVSNISSALAMFLGQKACAEGLMSMIWVPTYPYALLLSPLHISNFHLPPSSWPSFLFSNPLDF